MFTRVYVEYVECNLQEAARGCSSGIESGRPATVMPWYSLLYSLVYTVHKSVHYTVHCTL